MGVDNGCLFGCGILMGLRRRRRRTLRKFIAQMKWQTRYWTNYLSMVERTIKWIESNRVLVVLESLDRGNNNKHQALGQCGNDDVRFMGHITLLINIFHHPTPPHAKKKKKKKNRNYNFPIKRKKLLISRIFFVFGQKPILFCKMWIFSEIYFFYVLFFCYLG